MNICILSQYPPQIGGVATYTKQLEEELVKNNHNVYVVTYKQDCPRENNVFEANTINLPILRGISFIFSSYRLLCKIIDEYDIDVVHANYVLPQGFVASLVKRKKDVKIITTSHGSDINILAKNRILQPIIKYSLNKADDIYFVSEKLKEKAKFLNITDFEKKTTITPNTVNTNKFKAIPSNKRKLIKIYNKPIVMFIGNLVKQKGLNYLLEAKKLSKSDYTLLIYGDGKERTNLENYIKKEELKDTYLMGKTSTPEKIIPESDIMVLPSISEGASIIALESMSTARPLISTDTGNIKEIIVNNENGIIVNSRDSKQLASKIDELVEDKKKREKLGENARKTIVENYSSMKIPYIK